MNQIKNRRFGSAVSRMALGCLVILVSSVAAVNSVALLMGERFYNSPVLQILVNDLGLYLVGLPLAYCIWLTVPGGPMPIRPKRTLKPMLFVGYGLFALALGYLASFVTNLLLQLGGLNNTSAAEEMVFELPPWAALLFVAILPAILEELIFRGILYQKLGRFGEKPYVLLSGLLFGLFHGNASQFLFAMVLGCCFALLVSRTGTILYGVMLHFLVNFLSAVLIAPLAYEPEMQLLMGLWVPACIALGVAFFFLQREHLRLRKGTDLPPHPVRAALLNPGMLAFLALWLVLTLLTFYS